MSKQIYVHTRTGRRAHAVGADEKVGDLRDGDASSSVWLEDSDDPLDLERALAEVVKEHAQVHVSRCHRVDVRVRYGGLDKTKSFAPGTTIARVFAWATTKDGFDLSPAERAKHTLQLCGQTTQPDKSDHVGSLADDECTACFDLTPKERFEG